MIRFRCRCGHVLEAPRQAAGGDIQCPRCGWLQSVPELHELDRLAEDGTFRLVEGTASGETAGSRPIDFPSRLDSSGVDRHQTIEEILRVGARQDELRRPARQRYDPETGELITPFDLVEPVDWTPPVRTISKPQAPETSDPADTVLINHAPLAEPLAPPVTPPQPPTLGYAAPASDYGKLVVGQPPIPLHVRPVFFHTIAFELLQPANVLVLAFTFAVHLAAQGLSILTLLGGFPLALVVLWLWLTILAHYVTVIDETGPERRDELPSVMRNVHPVDDFFKPLLAFLLSLLICLGPAAWVGREILGWSLEVLLGLSGAATGQQPGPAAIAVSASLFVGGVLLFPATLLTAATSGVYLNLAPHRVLGVVRAAPPKYMLTVLALSSTLVSYVVALSAMGYLTLALAGWMPVSGRAKLVAAVIAYPSLFAAVYLAHWFTWMLGKIYQEHHDEFGWVWQRHISTRKDAMKQLEHQKAAQIRAEREERSRNAQQGAQTEVIARH